MVTIPSAVNLGTRSIPQSGRSIASYDGSAGAQGLIAAGKQVAAFGAEATKLAEEQKKQRDKLESANVMLEAMQKDAEYEDAFRKNPGSYKTAVQDYDKMHSELLPTLAAKVSDPQQREMTIIALKEQQLRTRSGLSALSRSYESDTTKAYLTDSFANARQSIKTTDDVSRLMMVRKAQYDGYVAAGVLSADDAARMFQAERREAQSVYVNQRITADPLALWKELENAPLNVRNNNPGNIRGADGQFRKFATPEEGLAAMEADLNVKVSGKSAAMERNFGKGYVPSIRNVISTWAPKSENDTNAYINTVAKESGLDPDAPLTAADVKKIMPAMIKVEGGSNSMAYYGNRTDGTPKGSGFLGELKRPDGSVSTEITVGVNIDGKEMDIPTLVPTLTKPEIDSLLAGNKPTQEIVQKAVDHAKKRMAEGKSVFADEPAQSPYFTQLDPDIKDAALRQLRPIIEQNLKKRIADVVAQASDGLAYEPIDPKELEIAEMRQPGITDSYNLSVKQAQQSFELLDQSPEEMAQTINAFKPDPANTVSYAAQAEAYKGIVESAQKARERQIKQTAEAAILSDPYIQGLADGADNSPETMRAYLTEVGNKAKDWGVLNPKLLTEQMELNIANRLGGKYNNREDRMLELMRVREASGEHFADVISQVAPKVGNEILAAAAIMEANPRDTTLATTIMNNYGVDDKEIEALVAAGSTYDKPSVGEVLKSDEYNEKMKDFNAALIQVDPSPDGQAKVTALNRQIIRAGFAYAKAGGMGLDAGIAKAIEQAKSGFTYVSQGGKMYDGSGAPPIPVPVGMNAAMVERHADRLIDVIAASGKLKTTFVQSDGSERTDEDISDSVVSDAFWVRDPKGLRLVMPVATGNIDVQYADTGKPVIKTWDDFTTATNSVASVAAIKDPVAKEKEAHRLALLYPARERPPEVDKLLKDSRRELFQFNKEQEAKRATLIGQQRLKKMEERKRRSGL